MSIEKAFMFGLRVWAAVVWILAALWVVSLVGLVLLIALHTNIVWIAITGTVFAGLSLALRRGK